MQWKKSLKPINEKGSLNKQITMHPHLALQRFQVHPILIKKQIKNDVRKKMVMQFL
jgi:hypothetical protein